MYIKKLDQTRIRDYKLTKVLYKMFGNPLRFYNNSETPIYVKSSNYIKSSKCLKCNRICKKYNLCSTHYHESIGKKCTICNLPVYAEIYNMCERHYKYYVYYIPLKIKVFDILGWSCSCCGNKEIYNLIVDHIDPKIKTKSHLNIVYLFRKIINDPLTAKNTFQILCWACNNSKKRNHKCSLNHSISTREQLINFVESLNLPTIKSRGIYSKHKLI